VGSCDGAGCGGSGGAGSGSGGALVARSSPRSKSKPAFCTLYVLPVHQLLVHAGNATPMVVTQLHAVALPFFLGGGHFLISGNVSKDALISWKTSTDVMRRP
jgi:hypothetical protein